MGRRQGSQQGDRGVLWQLGTVICCAVLSSASMGSPVQLHSAHPHAVERAEFAVRELQGLSDTGIFRTLSLKSISAAATQDGVFHYNTLLTLDLASPYFSSGRQEERFEVVVMEHKEDGHVSFSIDSFPDMDREALEHFYIQKVNLSKIREGKPWVLKSPVDWNDTKRDYDDPVSQNSSAKGLFVEAHLNGFVDLVLSSSWVSCGGKYLPIIHTRTDTFFNASCTRLKSCLQGCEMTSGIV